jgi:hypothetical protein
VSCLHIPEPAPPPCHEAVPDAPADDCSHDHDRIVARAASPSIAHHAAIVPVVIAAVMTTHVIADHSTGNGRPVAPRASPHAILRV